MGAMRRPAADAEGLASSEASRAIKDGSFTRVQLFNILLMMIFMGSQLTLPYTLSVFMVRDFFSAEGKSEQVVAQLAGLLASTQSLGRAIASFPWGMISDVVGRKVVIIVGLCAAMVSLLGYGSSTTYLAALLRRFIPSLLIGAPVAIKAALGDVCDQEGQAKAMAIFSLGYGIGSVLGPVLGGTLAYPCTKFSGFPYCGQDDFFAQRPYFLPCLAVSCLGVLSLLSMTLLLVETHPQVANAPGGWQGNLIRVLTCRRRAVAEDGTAEGDFDAEGSVDIEQEERQQRENGDIEMGMVDRANKHSAEASDGSEGSSLGASELGSPESKPSKPSSKPPGFEVAHDKKGEEPEKDNQDFREQESAALLQDESDSQGVGGTTEMRWWKDGNILLALVGAAIMALLFNFQDELAPIFVSAPKKEGGIAMSLEAFTWPISCGGAFLILYSLTVYPRIIKALGARTFARLGLIFAIPGALLLPLSSLLSPYALQQVCLYAAIMVNNLAKVTGLNSSIIAVNLVAPKKSMGRINGAAMALQSAGRALGPLLSGGVWALSVTLHKPGQQFIGFAFIAAALFATQFLYAFLRLPQ